jgi:hypothetical protein
VWTRTQTPRDPVPDRRSMAIASRPDQSTRVASAVTTAINGSSS